MTANQKPTVFGIAMRNFTKYPEMPDARALIDYGVRMEELGYESVWAWDHGALAPFNFMVVGSTTTLTSPYMTRVQGHRRTSKATSLGVSFWG